MYEYKCIQIPMSITAKTTAKSNDDSYAADYLESIINKVAESGFEFYRIDNMTISEKPGCMAALKGKKEGFYEVGVITFRRLKSE